MFVPCNLNGLLKYGVLKSIFSCISLWRKFGLLETDTEEDSIIRISENL